MLVAVVVAGVVVGLVRRRPSRFARPRWVAIVIAAAIVQVISASLRGAPHAALLVASIALGALWVAVQRRHLASWLLTAGVGANVVVVAANRGMPVDESALVEAGRSGTDVTAGFLYKHVPMTESTRLAWLGDRLPVPIQHNVISAGDVVMLIAIGLWVADSVGGWRAARRSAGAVDSQLAGRPCRKIVGGGQESDVA